MNGHRQTAPVGPKSVNSCTAAKSLAIQSPRRLEQAATAAHRSQAPLRSWGWWL